METNELYNLFLNHPIISTDSRNIFPGSIFFALKGGNFDGNKFAEESLKGGAEYAVVDDRSIVQNKKIILVENVLKALQQLAAFHRRKLKIPIIAITGTNGKTTTKELIASILSKKYRICFTKGNLNNHIGVPLTLLRIKQDTEIGIIEMGANHPGEINKLCEISDPDFGLITNVGKAHLEGFGSFDGVKKTKAELYQYLKKKGGKVFINNDNKILKSLVDHSISEIEYGTKPNVFMRGEIVNQTPFLNIRIWFPKGLLYINSKLIGSYNFENLLAAISVGKYFKMEPLQIQDAIKNYYPDNNRSQLIEKNTNTIIMDAYNANPTSMQASITNFISIQGKHKCLILGDMLELGKDSQLEHQLIIDFVTGQLFDKVFIIGDFFSKSTFKMPIKAFKTTNSFLEYLSYHPIKESFILIKGSRGLQLEKVLAVI